MDLVHLGGLRSENTSHLEHYDLFFFLLQWMIQHVFILSVSVSKNLVSQQTLSDIHFIALCWPFLSLIL